LEVQQTKRQFDPAIGWQFICGLCFRARRKLATAGVGVLVLWMGFHVVFGANGMMVYYAKRSEYKKLQKDLRQLEQENQNLSKEVDELRNDPEAIEREAREQLHYTKKGEVVYLLPKQTRPEAPSSDSSAHLTK
jgi:cell division protein FtsB